MLLLFLGGQGSQSLWEGSRGALGFLRDCLLNVCVCVCVYMIHTCFKIKLSGVPVMDQRKQI